MLDKNIANYLKKVTLKVLFVSLRDILDTKSYFCIIFYKFVLKIRENYFYI